MRIGRFSAKAIAENAASQSKGFLGEYAEQYSAATKEEFWNDAKKLQRKVNKEKISSLDKVKKIARGLKLKWAVPIGVTTTLLSKMGFGAMGHLMTTEMGDAELPKESMIDIENLDFSAPSANAQLLEQMSQDAVMKAGGGMMNIDEMIRPIGMAGGGNPMDELISRRAMIVGQLNAERGVPGVLGGGMNEEKVRVLQIELDQIDRMISMIQGKGE
jgi:hypothetical protein